MLRYKLPTSNQKKISIHLKKSTGCLWARKVWQPSALHEAAVQHLIPTVLLAWKIPYTQEFFWTERGFISAYRPEHRTVSQLEGHPCSKIHTETIWRALTSPRNNFTPMSWENTNGSFCCWAQPEKSLYVIMSFCRNSDLRCLFSQVLSHLILTVKLWQNVNGCMIPLLQMGNWFSGVQCSAQGPQDWFMENPDLLMLKAMLFHVISLTWRSWPSRGVSKPYIYKKYKLMHSDVEHQCKRLRCAISPQYLGQVREDSPWCLPPCSALCYMMGRVQGDM